jgi:cobalt-zinc-cadmium efflux system protein
MSGHSHSAHRHDSPAHSALPLALVLTLGFAGVEAAAGIWAGSLALLGDAGHMLTDAAALGFAAVAGRLSRRPPSHSHSFGLARLEVLAGLFNAGFMIALVLGLIWGAVARLLAPQPVQGGTVIWVAAAGLVLNLGVAGILLPGKRDLNTRAALLHVMGDALGSVAALASGLVIRYTGWIQADPLLTLFISLLILVSSLRLAREAVHTLLEGVPPELSLPEVGGRMAAVTGVISVHDLHIWSITSGRVALSAHVVVKDEGEWRSVLEAVRRTLRDEFDIHHATLQPEARAEQAIPLDEVKASLRGG